jgi:hypothetical protein
MSDGTKNNHLKRRRNARKELSTLFANAKDVVVIHYSCESFYDRSDGSSPRITSIAVRNLESGQTKSFSIHQMAEIKKVKVDQIASKYNDFEKQMLGDFFEYAKSHIRCSWLHWNMRDINFGFSAIEHRFQVLGGKAVHIPEANRIDLSRILIALYGKDYIGHPRLDSLMTLNSISAKDFPIGAEEARAFIEGEYVKLHQSTLKKVDVLANIAERAENDTLLTNATWWEKKGLTIAASFESLKKHWVFSAIAVILAITGLIFKSYHLLLNLL